jgi:hypothetical protein
MPDIYLDNWAKMLNTDVSGLSDEQKRKKILQKLQDSHDKPLTPEEVEQICKDHDLTFFEGALASIYIREFQLSSLVGWK